MRRAIILVLLMCSLCLARRDYDYGPDWLDLEKKANCVIVTPEDDLSAKYDWLKSSNRDGAMGALSSTNWRWILLAPGTHTLSSGLTMDTDYVGISGMAGKNYEAVTVTMTTADSGAIITQTADVICLQGFYLYHAGSSSGDNWVAGLDLNPSSDNSGSYYRDMKFGVATPRQSFPTLYDAAGVVCNHDKAIQGTWWNCHSGNRSWRVYDGQTLGGTWYYCTAGLLSWGGDGQGTGNGEITGSFYYCDGADRVWGGCASFGIDVAASALFYRCTADEMSLAMGKEFAGSIIECDLGYEVCGGYSGSGTDYGRFSGYARDVAFLVDSGNRRSFGQGNGSCAFSGTIDNVRGYVTTLRTGNETSIGGLGTFSATGKVINCGAAQPVDCTADTTIYALDSGTHYTNDGDVDAINFSLPGAAEGLEYFFYDVEDGANIDLTVSANGFDTIDSYNGDIIADDDAHQYVHIKCVESGQWHIIGSSGTWD